MIAMYRRARDGMDETKELPKRKTLRLQGFDYTTAGAYFITVCTKGRKLLFSPVGADSISARNSATT